MESVPQNRVSKLEALYSALLERAGHGLSNQKSGHRTVCVILVELLVVSTLWLVTSPGWLNWMWRCLGEAESNGHSGNSTRLLLCWYPRVLELSKCLSYLSFPSIQTNKGGHTKDICTVFCVSSQETWRLAQCFALEGLITSSRRYGPMEAIVPWWEELLRCCTDMTLLHFFNELDPFLICFPKRFCPTDGVSVTHTMRVKGMLSRYSVLASQSLLSCY